jgi:hypothetical protein
MLNFGGCIAGVQNATAAGSCGNQYNDYEACIALECRTCSDFKTVGPLDLACVKRATAPLGRCSAAVPDSTCEAAIRAGGSLSGCLTGEAMLNTWCGP